VRWPLDYSSGGQGVLNTPAFYATVLGPARIGQAGILSIDIFNQPPANPKVRLRSHAFAPNHHHSLGQCDVDGTNGSLPEVAGETLSLEMKDRDTELLVAGSNLEEHHGCCKSTD
jgi:hypothetical protein